MTSINDVLKASKGLPVDDIFAELWGRKLSGDYTIVTYTGTLPATITGTKAGYLHRYKIYGNTEQTGTPTPENPIVPSECGERTANEAWTGWAQDYVTRINTSQRARLETVDGRTCLLFAVSAGADDYDSKYIFKTDWKENTRYTFSFDALRLSTQSTASTMQVWYTDGSSEPFPRTINSGAFESYTFTTAVDKTIKYITPYYSSGDFRIDINTFMVNEGSTAPTSYEPYGYKLPLTSAGQDMDIYINAEPLRKIGNYADYIDYGTGKIVRQVEKIELTGNENIAKNTASATNYLFYTPRGTLTGSILKTPIVCDRLRAVGSAPVAQIGINTNNNYNMVYFNLGADIMNAQPSGNTIDGCKEYLANQYTAGTPVTIWYVLATPIEEDPPVPFPQIPTTAGSTTISWAGSGLAPSEVELEYERE